MTKMWNTGILLILVVFCSIGGVFCSSGTVMEGESVTIDCGFQTIISGGNLMWEKVSTDSETLLGHIVPGDRFCGTDNITCTVHPNGSITLVNVSMDDGDKRYRCLRGDEEGYHSFSDFHLTVLTKESVVPPVIQTPNTGSSAKVFMIGKKGVIHSYEQSTCKDDEDGDLIVTCNPPSGVIVDKVYDQVNCSCTDSDGNSNSLNIAVSSHTKLIEMHVAVIVISGCALFLTLLVILLVCKCKAYKKQSTTEQDPERQPNPEGNNGSQRQNGSGTQCNNVGVNMTNPGEGNQAGSQEPTAGAGTQLQAETQQNRKASELEEKVQPEENVEECKTPLLSPGEQTSNEDSDSGEGKNNRRKIRDPERRLTASGKAVDVPKDETPGTDPSGSNGKDDFQPFNDSGINASMINEKSGSDEIDSCTNGIDLWQKFWINNEQMCKGFDLTFTCNGPGFKIEVRENDTQPENICSIAFEDDVISYKCGNVNKTFFYKAGETKYKVNTRRE